MTDGEFDSGFSEHVLPVLSRAGFRRVLQPDGWFAPPRLYELNDVWCSSSWNRRDCYFEFSVGRLHLFRDVWPRVIVHGGLELGTAIQDMGLKSIREFLQEAATRFPAALAAFEAGEKAGGPRPPPLNKKARRRRAEFYSRLGERINIDEWAGCRIA